MHRDHHRYNELTHRVDALLQEQCGGFVTQPTARDGSSSDIFPSLPHGHLWNADRSVLFREGPARVALIGSRWFDGRKAEPRSTLDALTE